MQIREHGKQILMIRTKYVPEKKRTVPVTVAKQDRWLSTVADDVRQQLAKDEVEQLEKWLSERTARESVDNLKGSLSILGSVVRQSTKALSVESISSSLSQSDAESIYSDIDALLKALRKSGYKRAVKAKAALSVDNSNQLVIDEK